MGAKAPILIGEIYMARLFSGLFQQQFNQLSAVVPTANYSYVAYYPSWATEYFNSTDTSTSLRKPSNIPDYFTHCFIAFGSSKMSFDKTAPDLAKAKTGLDFPVTAAELKSDLVKLKARGIKTFISIGGATYGRPDVSDAWTALSAEGKKSTVTRTDTPIIKSISEFIQYFDIDGCDLDFEDDPAYWGTRAQYLEGYYYLLKAMDMARKDAASALGRTCLVGSACWSTGWDQTAPTKADANTYKSSHGLTSYWGDRAGRERQVFSGFTGVDGTTKFNATAFVDVFVNMTYDFGPQTINTAIFYDPIQAYKECRECVTDANKVVTLGICPEPFGWGQAKMMVNDADCATAGTTHATRLTNDQYQRALDKPFSVEDLCNRFKTSSTGFGKDGFILWSVYAVAGTYTYNSKASANATTASRKISSMLKIGTDTTKIIHR